MNDFSLQPKVQAHPAVTWVLLGLMVLFALNSYPMMYPGYDFEHHLSNIRAVSSLANNDWHQAWAFVFQWLQVPDVDTTRALIIHRTQTLLTLGLLLTSAHLFLGVALPKLGAHARLQLAVVATVVWLMMHGTYSSPAGEPHYSARHILSWLQWYSVNYQIALPMFFFGSATLLKAVTATHLRHTVLWSALTLVTAYLIARIHAAELVYFLFVAGGIFAIYVLPNQRWYVLLLTAAVLALALKFGLMFSYRQPVILELMHPSRWGELVAKMNEFGHLLVGNNLNRSETTWHSLYTVSLLAVVGSIFWANNKGAVQLALLLVFSSLLAIGIHIHHSAGLLALVIGEYVTWRFGFSTLLFLGIPLLVGVWLERRPHTDSPLRTSVLALGVPAGLLVLVALYSRFFEPLHPAYNFAKSLLFSLDPVLGHFPITP
jgi:hypothetical protein